VADTIDLSLVSHTNSGKTTLARTLLRANVGEVRDEAHVTSSAEPYTMIETPDLDVLRLWDTPGFGDSVRLAKRLAQRSNPIGWFLAEVWDRWRDRPLWSSQQAMKNVRDRADVVLYLVNASEDPANAGYVTPEMQILDWIGKPVLVLLNQTGQPRSRTLEEADEERWRTHLRGYGFVCKPLTLDAFARCWVQEFVLLRAVDDALPEEKRVAFRRLEAAWQSRRIAQFDASMDALAEQLARVACARAEQDESRARSTLRDVARAIGLGSNDESNAKEQAMQRLAKQLDEDIRAATDQMIEINGLEGRAAADVLSRLAENVEVQAPMDESKAAMLGGVVSGAVSGLAADLAAGGLTFGAGFLIGGLIGALGGAGAARGYNRFAGIEGTTVRWSDQFLGGLTNAALLRYLAIAHYGRGRGEWKQSEYPQFWKQEVETVMHDRREAWSAIWREREGTCDVAMLRTRIQGPLREAGYALLERLYPAALAGRASGENASHWKDE
jgi:hypothetical protein